MRPIARGDLVVTDDGYHAIVLDVGPEALTLFLANGLTCPYAVWDRTAPARVTPLDIRVDGGTGSPANFAEILQGDPRRRFTHWRLPQPREAPEKTGVGTDPR